MSVEQYMRQISQAAADRAMPPLLCPGIYDHQWAPYGEQMTFYPLNGQSEQVDTILLWVCSRCRKTPEEATRP